MEQPKGFKVKGQEGKVMHLKHAIYICYQTWGFLSIKTNPLLLSYI
jgi:hypothetical protein